VARWIVSLHIKVGPILFEDECSLASMYFLFFTLSTIPYLNCRAVTAVATCAEADTYLCNLTADACIGHHFVRV
jgi:hypothetical protein